MNVNSAFILVARNRRVLAGGLLIAVVIIVLATTSFTKRSEKDLLSTRANLAIREIGHHLLLHAGDSSSRIPPVVEKAEGVFQLVFENEFAFKPDTLVALTQRSLAKTSLSDYTVTVYECFKPEIVYGFQISPPANNIQACNGRKQPQGCYIIQIAFANFPNDIAEYTTGSLIAGTILMLCAMLLIVTSIGKRKVVAGTLENQQSVKSTYPFIGQFEFDLPNHRLIMNNAFVELTEKECKILELLNRNFGGLTPRENIIQEIWTNEGVVTGRSLDMFISKLRKKLSRDPALRITNMHGLGYKLETVNL